MLAPQQQRYREKNKNIGQFGLKMLLAPVLTVQIISPGWIGTPMAYGPFNRPATRPSVPPTSVFFVVVNRNKSRKN